MSDVEKDVCQEQMLARMKVTLLERAELFQAKTVDDLVEFMDQHRPLFDCLEATAQAMHSLLGFNEQQIGTSCLLFALMAFDKPHREQLEAQQPKQFELDLAQLIKAAGRG